MTDRISMDTILSLRQAFLIMHAYIERHWESVGRPDDMANLLGELSLWKTENGYKEPMDGAVFPAWLSCAEAVLTAEGKAEGYRGADILLYGKPPTVKVQR